MVIDMVDIGIYFSTGSENSPIITALNLETREIIDVPLNGTFPEKAVIALRTEEAYALAKALNEYFAAKGAKPPNDETYLKGKLEATEGHLKDMRNIVFDRVLVSEDE